MLCSYKTVARTTFLLVVLVFSIVSMSFGTQSSSNISASGMISYLPRVDITVNINNIIGVNNLSLGFMLDWEWKSWVDSSVRRELAQNACFKLVRLFDFRQTSPRLMPCVYWNESSKTGTWDWTNVDTLVQRIFEIGAEPLFCLGWARDNIQNYIPNGMAVNSETLLPSPESYAAYATEWVKHFNNKGAPWSNVRYYGIMNEPHFYFGWGPDTTKLDNFIELWNTVARSMRKENPNVLLSHDSITIKWVFNNWLLKGDDVDYLDFHKYDSDTIGKYSDTEMFTRAESRKFDTDSVFYGIVEVRQRWASARGELLPAIISESNFNSAYETGTDPDIQKVVGTTWLALVIRKCILYEFDHYVYYSWHSSASKPRESGGLGFGMVNSDNNEPWYPYYLQHLIGNNLDVGDLLVETTSSSDKIRTLGWIHGNTLNMLLVVITNEPINVYVEGTGTQLTFQRIDETISYLEPSIQVGLVGPTGWLTTEGYTILLLQNEL